MHVKKGSWVSTESIKNYYVFVAEIEEGLFQVVEFTLKNNCGLGTPLEEDFVILCGMNNIKFYMKHILNSPSKFLNHRCRNAILKCMDTHISSYNMKDYDDKVLEKAATWYYEGIEDLRKKTKHIWKHSLVMMLYYSINDEYIEL